MEILTLAFEDRILLERLITELKRLNDREEETKRDIVLTVQQAAAMLGCSRQTISRKIREGRLHKVERGGVIGILQSELG